MVVFGELSEDTREIGPGAQDRKSSLKTAVRGALGSFPIAVILQPTATLVGYRNRHPAGFEILPIAFAASAPCETANPFRATLSADNRHLIGACNFLISRRMNGLLYIIQILFTGRVGQFSLAFAPTKRRRQSLPDLTIGQGDFSYWVTRIRWNRDPGQSMTIHAFRDPLPICANAWMRFASILGGVHQQDKRRLKT